MTSTVKVTAHCGDKREVKITLIDFGGEVRETIVKLQDGQSYECVVYDTRSVSIEEPLKED